jgi:hypothetical protein
MYLPTDDVIWGLPCRSFMKTISLERGGRISIVNRPCESHAFHAEPGECQSSGLSQDLCQDNHYRLSDNPVNFGDRVVWSSSCRPPGDPQLSRRRQRSCMHKTTDFMHYSTTGHGPVGIYETIITTIRRNLHLSDLQLYISETIDFSASIIVEYRGLFRMSMEQKSSEP